MAIAIRSLEDLIHRRKFRACVGNLQIEARAPWRPQPRRHDDSGRVQVHCLAEPGAAFPDVAHCFLAYPEQASHIARAEDLAFCCSLIGKFDFEYFDCLLSCKDSSSLAGLEGCQQLQLATSKCFLPFVWKKNNNQFDTCF